MNVLQITSRHTHENMYVIMEYRMLAGRMTTMNCCFITENSHRLFQYLFNKSVGLFCQCL